MSSDPQPSRDPTLPRTPLPAPSRRHFSYSTSKQRGDHRCRAPLPSEYLWCLRCTECKAGQSRLPVHKRQVELRYCLRPLDVTARVYFGCGLRSLEDDAPLRFVLRRSDGLIKHRLYGITRLTSMPQEAETISFGAASFIRVANSSAANPPKTTEWIAPMRAQASIASMPPGPSACR